MSAHGSKRKIDTECRVFNKTWTKYLFTEVKGKAVCLVCGVQVAVFKDYNLNRHYVTKHEEKYKNVSEQEHAKESDALLAKLQNQQGLFTKCCTSRDAAVKTSYVISHKIARKSKPFSDGEFIKECLLDSAALICPEKKGAFENVPLSRRTVTRRVEDIYSSLKEENFPHMRRHAQKILVLFGSTYVCEQTFSVMKFNKSRYRSSITDDHLSAVLRISTSDIQPDFNALVQAQSRLDFSH